MNRKERRAAKKQKNGLIDINPSDFWNATNYTYKPIPDPIPETEVPGVNVPPIDAFFSEMVASNVWHDRSQIELFFQTIRTLSTPLDFTRTIIKRADQIEEKKEKKDEDWCWSKNWNCKYVNIRFDMRDGGFIMTNDKGKRINLDQLKWQWRSLDKDEK